MHREHSIKTSVHSVILCETRGTMNIIQSIARKLNRKCPCIHTWTCAATAVLCLLLILTSCSGDSPLDDSHTDTPDNTPNMAVTFDSYTTSTTRATDETSYLQKNGFGVFAYYTEAKEWKATTDPTPNFMYNQEVNYSSNSWTYDPIKYWPNDNTPADNLGATGSQTHSYLSFFAYAPYTNVDVSSGTAVAKATTGITALTSNTIPGDPKVTYTAPTSPDLSTAVDLMWGTATDYQSDYIYSNWSTTAGLPLTDLFKPSVQQTVKFKFQHALAQMRVTIHAEDYIYPDNSELGDATRILVNSINITGLGPESAVLNLDNTTKNTPLWENVSETPSAHNIELTNTTTKTEGGTDYLMNDEIRNTYTTDDNKTTIKDQYSGLTATAFEASTFPKGVTKTAKPVYNITDGTTESDWAYLFIPANATDATKSLNTLDVSVDYDIITRDDALKNSTIPGFTILKNNYSGTLTLSGDETFKAGHKYTLNIILGVHSIQFTVESVDEWGNEETITPQTSN